MGEARMTIDVPVWAEVSQTKQESGAYVIEGVVYANGAVISSVMATAIDLASANTAEDEMKRHFEAVEIEVREPGEHELHDPGEDGLPPRLGPEWPDGHRATVVRWSVLRDDGERLHGAISAGLIASDEGPDVWADLGLTVRQTVLRGHEAFDHVG